MDAVTPVNLLVALAAGVLSFASPCMLPLVPGYLGWLGAGVADSGSAGSAGVAGSVAARRQLVRNALLFVGGFTIVFVALGFGSGLAGGVLLEARRPAEVVGGVLIALLGLVILAGHRLPLRLQGRVGARLRPGGAGSAAGSVGFGVVFAAAWSPCIGPTLGAILTLAAAGGQPVGGAVLLAAFALGLGIPFVLLAAGVGGIEPVLAFTRRHLGAVRITSGVLLVAFGALLAGGVVGELSELLSRAGSPPL